MSDNKSVKKEIKKIFSASLPLIIGSVCGLFVANYVYSYSGTMFDLAVLIIGVYAALLMQIIIHEAGHLVFGLISGYGFSSFRIFSFTVMKANGKLKIRRMKVPGTAGQCIMIPPDFTDGKIPVLLYNFGGSLMNLIFAVIFIVLYFALSGMPSLLMLVFGAVGFMSAFLNGFPLRMGMVNNDGVNALEVVRDAEAMHSFWVQLKVVEQTAKGVRIKDMPCEWFVLPDDDSMKKSMTTVKSVLVCNRLMDSMEFERAGETIRHLLGIESGMVELHRRALISELIFIDIISGKSKNDIDGLLDNKQKNFMKKMKNNPSVMRTEYFYALICEKNNKKAESIKKRFNKVCKIYPYGSETELERELMSEEFINSLTQTHGVE